jgi:hypothetical protein
MIASDSILYTPYVFWIVVHISGVCTQPYINLVIISIIRILKKYIAGAFYSAVHFSMALRL